MDSGGKIYASDPINGRVLVFTADGTSVFATGIGLPEGVAVDAAGNVYVSDRGAFPGRVIVFQPDGTILTTISIPLVCRGPGFDPRGIAIDSQGRVIVGDGGSVRIFSAGPPVGGATPPEFDAPPAPTSGGTISVAVGGTANFIARASDIDSGDLVTITATGAPFGRGATFVTGPGNPATGVFSWTPGAGDVGGYVLTLTATDNSPSQLSSQRTVVIQVFQPVGFKCRGLTATIVGSPRSDILLGTSGDDVIVGLGGNDTICGNQGDDIITGGDGEDWIAGGPGDDLIQGNRGGDHIIGGPGADLLLGGPGADLVRRGDGNDQVAGGGGDDVLYGGVGSDKLLGGPGDDVLLGHRGQDSLDCGGGADIGDGGPHRDKGINCEVQRNVEA